jgi:hypothetical protein
MKKKKKIERPLPLSLERVAELYHLLRDGREIDEKARSDLKEFCLIYCRQAERERRGSRPGRRINPRTWELAFAALQIHDVYSFGIGNIICALLPQGTARDVDRVYAAYKKLVGGRGVRPFALIYDPRLLDAALARLSQGDDPKRWERERPKGVLQWDALPPMKIHREIYEHDGVDVEENESLIRTWDGK